VCYNSLDSYIDSLKDAIIRPHPDYAAIGIGEQGHERQLNTSLLQIENEFYSPIRPKRVARSGETPLGALRRGGIEYVEVRCIDVNPYLPVGIDAEQIKFLDTFLLFCLLSESPPCDDPEGHRLAGNQLKVVNRGRDPELTLAQDSGEERLETLARQALHAMAPIADALDRAHGGDGFCTVLQAQSYKVADASLTPSARILMDMRDRKLPFFSLMLEASLRWADHFRQTPLSPDRLAEFERESRASLQRQREVEAADAVDFETFLEAYYRQYDAL
jgi:glutamate--cysteine ligase